MATYAIGDIQGCGDELKRLLEVCRFDPVQDKLWLVGDLVNRGPDSLGVLRLVKSLGDAAVTVLGNHDISLLALAEGLGRSHPGDTMGNVLNAPDREDLLTWLRAQKLFHAENGYVLVHAGLLPQWSVAQAMALVAEVEAALHGPDYRELFAHLYGNQPVQWDDSLSGYDRLRVIINACTRLRVCTPSGAMEFKFKGELQNVPAGYLPWFDAPHRASTDTTVVCGHWSALGLMLRKDIIALDTGCLWGGMLTAIRLEDRQLFQVPCLTQPVAKDWK
ncbi:MAG: symmetrical bis(5'-nucleosyl)-tetraphosphatase [Nitrosomonadales bacterium]|nr:symmetrical bis(5'-nucleosyl)-tetraphosphatase [Nitrosomonadales bacterium]